MKKIFIGSIFVLFNLNLPFFGGSFDLFPDFVGYILIVAGFQEFANINSFQKGAKLAAVLAVLTSFFFVTKLLNLNEIMRFYFVNNNDMTRSSIDFCIDVIVLALCLEVFYCFTEGTKELEQQYKEYFNSLKLKKMWQIYSSFQVSVFLASTIIPVFINHSLHEEITEPSKGYSFPLFPFGFNHRQYSWLGNSISDSELAKTTFSMMLILLIVLMVSLVIRISYLATIYNTGEKYKKASQYTDAPAGPESFPINGAYRPIPHEFDQKLSQHYTNADEILKYKRLLDAGAITPEEFDAIKKRLMELDTNPPSGI